MALHLLREEELNESNPTREQSHELAPRPKLSPRAKPPNSALLQPHLQVEGRNVSRPFLPSEGRLRVPLHHHLVVPYPKLHQVSLELESLSLKRNLSSLRLLPHLPMRQNPHRSHQNLPKETLKLPRERPHAGVESVTELFMEVRRT